MISAAVPQWVGEQCDRLCVEFEYVNGAVLPQTDTNLQIGELGKITVGQDVCVCLVVCLSVWPCGGPAKKTHPVPAGIDSSSAHNPKKGLKSIKKKVK